MSINLYDHFSEMEKSYILETTTDGDVNDIGEITPIVSTVEIRGIMSNGSRQERELMGEKNTAKNTKIFRTKHAGISIDDTIIDDTVQYRVIFIEEIGMGAIGHYKLILSNYE